MKRLCILISLGTLLCSCGTTKGVLIEDSFRWGGDCKAQVYFEEVQDTLLVDCPCFKNSGNTIRRKL